MANKEFILEKVRQGEYNQTQLLGWLTALPSSKHDKGVAPSDEECKVGDVFMHPAFIHPYVMLKHKGGTEWVCILLTSSTGCMEILEPCNSRLFRKSFFVKNLFTTQKPVGLFMGCFDNDKQLKEVYKKVKKYL